MRHVHRFTCKTLRVIAVICWLCLPVTAMAAEDCSLVAGRAHAEMQEIEKTLLAIASLQQYEMAIESRYDKVEGLLASIDECLHQEAKSELHAWQRVLHTLRAHARTLVFNHFENWVEVKNSEIELLKKAMGTEKDQTQSDVKVDVPVSRQSPEKI